MKKIFVIFIVFSLFISSLCIDGCSTDASPCTACKDGYLINSDGSACLYGCQTLIAAGETDGGKKCATCKTSDVLLTDKSGCLHGCKTEGGTGAEGTCAECNTGYLITLAKTCIKGCKTADDTASSAKCKTCTTEANLSTDGLSCIANCKTTGHNSEVCSECASGYTLSTDKTSCTAETKKEDDTKEDDKSSSFGLYSSLLIFALVLLF